MNIKIVAPVAIIAAFGIGIAIPNIAGAGKSIDSYDEAKAIVEGKELTKSEENTANTVATSEQPEDTAVGDVSLSENNTDETATEAASEAYDDEKSAVTDSDADVVLDFTFDDIKIKVIF